MLALTTFLLKRKVVRKETRGFRFPRTPKTARKGSAPWTPAGVESGN